MRTICWLVSLSVWACGPGGALGQEPAPCGQPFPSWCGLSPEQAGFLLLSRRATELYASPAAAVADGYRPVGADAPAMGRHWISLARLFDGEIDPARPEILMYAAVDGREMLVGIGFGYVVGSGDRRAPPPNPFEPDSWHVHSGRLDMESHRTDHDGHGPDGGESVFHGGQEAGVSVLHAWVRVENPSGVTEPNNWALPWLRLGLSRPDGATAAADRAISLVTVGADFFVRRAKLFTDNGSGQETRRPAAVRDAEVEVMEWWQTRSTGPLTPVEIEWLDQLSRRYGLIGPQERPSRKSVVVPSGGYGNKRTRLRLVERSAPAQRVARLFGPARSQPQQP